MANVRFIKNILTQSRITLFKKTVSADRSILRHVNKQPKKLANSSSTSQGCHVITPIAKNLVGASVVSTLNRTFSNMCKADNPLVEKKDVNQNRLASVDKLKKNMSFDQKSYEKYIQSISLSPDNPFFSILTSSGQVKWISKSPVSAKHVHEVVRSTVAVGRSLHINTGTHGSKEGGTVVDHPQFAEAQFTKEDIDFVWDELNVSLHIMSKHSPALTEKQYPSTDIIDAWCYSEASQHVMRNESDPLEKRLQEFIMEKICKQPPQPSNLPNNSIIGEMSGDAKNTNHGIQAPGSNFTGNTFNFMQGNRNPSNIATEAKNHTSDNGVSGAIELQEGLTSKKGITLTAVDAEKPSGPVSGTVKSGGKIEANDDVVITAVKIRR